MKATLLAFFIALAISLTPETGWSAGAGTKIVTRIDKVNAELKGGTLTIRVEGMASTPSLLGRGGELLRRGQGPNKDGLLEYELVFNPSQKNYTGDALKPVKTTLKVSSIPPGTKGVRVYAEYNEMNSMLPEAKQAPVAKKETVVKKEETIVAKKEKPTLKKEELAPKKPEVVVKEEKKKRSWNWNPFHRQPVVEQVNVPPPAPTKKEALVLKKKETVVKKEEAVVKTEEVAPKKEEKKRRGWNLNPFHRKAAEPQANVTSPAPKKPELELKKKGPVVREEESFAIKKENPISKKEAELLKKEEVAPKKKEKKSWNLNPFHRKPAVSQTVTTPPEPKKKELVVTKEKPAPKKEEAAPPKKEETEKKKKDHWYWNPFHRKANASQDSDESPR